MVARTLKRAWLCSVRPMALRAVERTMTGRMELRPRRPLDDPLRDGREAQLVAPRMLRASFVI